MSADRTRRAEEIFLDAVEQSPDARSEFIRATCDGDAALQRAVESLLAHDDDANDGFLTGGGHVDRFADAAIPARLGSYRVVRLIGMGGMGAVYEAVQENPQRTVALKVIRAGLASRAVVRRFVQETRALAQLRHPGIAQIFEGGEFVLSGQRLPFFAMEFISGAPLDRHCASTKASVQRRLELMALIADAVHHAHERGIVHRDLKPRNILIDDAGNPKVVDFGVARIPAGTNATIVTGVGQIVGTMPYMSPEQIDGDQESIDARTDVYALGVVLYELLAGRVPLDIGNLPIAKAARALKEDEPTRLGTIDTLFRGDIETIASTAMAKDRDRRYASAAAFAADIRHHLRDEPIIARKSGTFVQLRKFARRNKGLVGGVVAAFIILAAGIVVSSWFAIGQARLRAEADRTAEVARRAAYIGSLASAQAAIESRDFSRLRASVDGADPAQRGWEWQFLDAVSRTAQFDTGPLESPIRAVATCDDQSIWLTLADGAVMRWEPPQMPVEIARFDPPAVSLSVSHDGEAIVIVSPVGISLMSRTGEVRWTQRGRYGAERLIFDADDSRLVVGEIDTSRIVLLDVASGQHIGVIGDVIPGLGAAGLSADGRLVVARTTETILLDRASSAVVSREVDHSPVFATGTSLRIRLDDDQRRFEVVDGDQAALGGTFPVKQGFDAIALARDFVAYGDEPGIVTIYGSRSLATLGRAILGTGLIAPYFMPDGHRFVAVMASPYGARIADASMISPVWSAPVAFDRPLSLDMSPVGDDIVSGGWGSLSFHDVRTGLRRITHFPTSEPVHSVSFSLDGTRATGLTIAGELIVCHVHGTPIVTRLKPLLQHAVTTTTLARWITPDQVALIEPAGWIAFLRIDAIGVASLEHTIDIGDRVTAATVDRAGLRVILGTSRSGIAAIAADGAVSTIGGALTSPFDVIGVSPDGASFAVGETSGRVQVLDAANGLVRCFTQLPRRVNSLAWSPDGSRIIGSSPDGNAVILDGATAEQLVLLKVPDNASVFDARFGNDGATAYAFTSSSLIVGFETTRAFDLELRRVHDIVRRVAPVATRLRDALLLAGDTVAAIESDPRLSEEEIAIARRMILAEGDPPRWLNSGAWGMVRPPGPSEEIARRAIRVAQRACEQSPGVGAFHNTLAIALLRQAELAEISDAERRESLERVLVELEEAHRLMLIAGGVTHPLNFAPRAVALARLGREQEADDAYNDAIEAMKAPAFSNDQECRQFLTEARLAIAASFS